MVFHVFCSFTAKQQWILMSWAVRTLQLEFHSGVTVELAVSPLGGLRRMVGVGQEFQADHCQDLDPPCSLHRDPNWNPSIGRYLSWVATPPE